jgi:ketosteroid isomerase-like protein
VTAQTDLLTSAYQLFNERRIDDALALMTDDVAWPDVANGAVLHGRGAVRPYWEAQFRTASPIVTPTRFIEAGDDVIAVVEQRVDTLDGETLVPLHEVFHRYSFGAGRVSRMVVFATEAEALRGATSA